jgi:hypothetical protein
MDAQPTAILGVGHSSKQRTVSRWQPIDVYDNSVTDGDPSWIHEIDRNSSPARSIIRCTYGSDTSPHLPIHVFYVWRSNRLFIARLGIHSWRALVVRCG